MSILSIDLLLVEDSPADVRLAQETLKDYKMQNLLHVVTDGEQALQYLRRQPPFEAAKRPDMVLLDLNLPKLDGLEVLEQLRSDPELKDLPVAILTSSHLDQQILKRYRVPVDCYILKPLTLERYLDAVRCFPQFGVSIVRVNTIDSPPVLKAGV